MEGMTYAKLMELFNSNVTILNVLWNIFVAVSLGVLGFLYRDTAMRRDFWTKVVFTVGFMLFVGGTFKAFKRSHSILSEISRVLEKASGQTEEFAGVFRAHVVAPERDFMLGYVAYAAIVLVSIWLRAPRSGEAEERRP